jgi:hypothetical protein
LAPEVTATFERGMRLLNARLQQEKIIYAKVIVSQSLDLSE